MLTVLIVMLCFFSHVTSIHAAIIINEISPRTIPEWVELYNTGTEAVDLTGWYLVDKAGSQKSLSELGSISPSSYLVYTDGNSWLNNTGEETLTLYASGSAEIADAVTFTETRENTSVARIPDLSGTWFVSQSPTPGSANLSPTPTPTPTPSPTVSPSPVVVAQTPTPSPSPLASPTPTPTPTPTPSPSVKPSPKLSPSPSASPTLEDSNEGTIAGETINLSAFTVSSAMPSPPTTHPTSELKLRTDRLKNLLMIGGGLILLSLSSYFGYRKYLSTRTIS